MQDLTNTWMSGNLQHPNQRDPGAEMAQAKYSTIKNANQAALQRRDVDPALLEQFYSFIVPLEALVGTAQRLPSILGMPEWTSTLTQAAGYGRQEVRTYTRQPVKMDDYMRQALAIGDQRRADAVSKSEQAAVDLITAALASACPKVPAAGSDGHADWLRRDIEALLESTDRAARQGVADQLVADAQAGGDKVTIALLLGGMDLVLRRLVGVDVVALQRSYVRRAVAAAPSGIRSSEVPAASAFIALQDDGNQSVGALIDAAVGAYDLSRQQVGALIIGR